MEPEFYFCVQRTYLLNIRVKPHRRLGVPSDRCPEIVQILATFNGVGTDETSD